MKRATFFAAALFAAAGCSDSERGTVGPEIPDPSANITSGIVGGAPGVSDVCGTVSDPTNGLPGTQIASPCDGDFGNADGPFPGPFLDLNKIPFTGSTWWLSSLDADPSPIPPNFGGIASLLKVKAYPYPDQAACEALQGGNPNVCSVRENLPAVTEVIDPNTSASLRYETAWKSSKQQGGNADLVPNDSYWQLVLFLDFDGDGVFGDTEDVASRILKWTDSPSTDQPINGWSLDINRGSNQPIKFVLEQNQSGCFGVGRDQNAVRCLIDFSQGGTLVVETSGDGTQGQVLEFGAGNDDIGIRLVTAEVCADGDVDVDTETYGTCITAELTPELDPSDPEFVDSFIYACESLPVDVGASTFLMQDEMGQQFLPPVDPGTACTDLGLTGFAQADPGTGLEFVLNKIKQVFVPRLLVATDGDSGSRLLTTRSDFQLVKTAQMQGENGVTSPTVPENSTTTISAVVKDHADSDASVGNVANAIVYAYSAAADPTSSVSCTFGPPSSATDPGPWCEDLTAAELAGFNASAWADDGVRIKTGPDGLASADATVGTTTAEFRFLGCSIGVPGSDTPADGGSPGDNGPCDRDPGDEDDGTAGFANGIAVNVVDPFMKDGVAVAEWANDLPLAFTLQVCSAPNVNGLKDAGDPWSDGAPSNCIPTGYSDSFGVNVGNNLGGATMADLEWMIATDGNGDRRLYFGLEVPMDADPTGKKVNVAIEFDKGSAADPGGTSDEFDDQIELSLDKFSVSPTGDAVDRYLKSSCTGSTSVCNSLDSDVGGDNDVIAAMAWTETNAATGEGFLFVEMSQVLDTDDPVITGTVDRKPDLNGFGTGDLGFLLQFGVGNVQQGGTVFPQQGSGGKTYRTFTIQP